MEGLYMKLSVFHNAIHFLSDYGCKVIIEKTGVFKLKTYSDNEVLIKEIDIEKFEEISLIRDLEQREFDKLGILKFAKSLGYSIVGRGM